jgi:hypothetical protein
MGEDASQRSDVDGAAAEQVDEAGSLPDDVYCPECDYNLRGLTSDRCPECGCAVDFARLAGSQIPWVHRRRIGWYRAYWQTVWLVMFRTKRFCDEIARPVSFRHSQSFRWVSVLHAFVPLAVLIALAWLIPPSVGTVLLPNAWALAGGLAVLIVSLFLLLAALTGLPSYFFQPRHLTTEEQNRGLALSYYACAALAWTPLAFVCVLMSMLAYWLDRGSLAGFYGWYNNDVAVVFKLLAILLPLGQLIAWWFDLIHISQRSMRRRLGAVARMALLVPALWVVVGSLILPGIPLVFLYVALIIVSFN